MLFLAQRIKYFDCENNKMDNKENLICNWMLWHSDDDFESIRVWEHSLLLLWLHLEVTKKKKKAGREENSGKKTGLKNLTSAEGEEGSTENCVSVSKELLPDSRP